MHRSATAGPRAWRHVLPIIALACMASGAVPSAARAQGHITTPKEFFGHDIGDDWFLANYTQFQGYWNKIAKESNRAVVQEIGKTAEGRPQLMMIVSSPENMKRLEHFREIAKKLALAENLTDAEARALSNEGKSVVWIDGGLHATEVLGAHQLIETSFQLLSRNDAETQRILRDDIVLLVHVNPDGMELVSNWYMQEKDTLKRNMNIPRLYQKYIGHDDNRDFYILNQNETINDARIQYHEWFPQIVYNHHQTGPAGTVMFAPPFRDPFNFNFDPLVPVELDLVAAAMHSRFEAEGKPGVTMRTGSSYSTWWNGGLRTAAYFHNMIGLLTETIGNPTPSEIPLIVRNQLPRADLPFPIAPQKWHFRQSIDYSITANWAVMDIASRYRENLLYNIYRMGKNSIDRGNRDSWTTTPTELDSLEAKIARDRAGTRAQGAGTDRLSAALNPFGATVPSKYFTEVLRDPARRDPRGYIIPSNQPDFLTATKFVNALRKVNVTVLRATSAFSAGGKQYPAGSFVVKSAQAFRPHVLDMFEPQDHPNDFAYPGGPPKAPYDNAGYTLAYQMGVQFDRLIDGFECPCERITGLATPPAGTVATNGGTAGFLLAHSTNDAFIAVNRALKAGKDVYWLKSPMTAGGKSYAAGTFYIGGGSASVSMLQKLASEQGLSFDGTNERPASDAVKLKPTRIALWDQYGGSMPSGHMRWMFEQYEFPFDVLYPQAIDAGNLSAKYDVLVLPTGAVPALRTGGAGGELSTLAEFFGRQPKAEDIPEQYRATLGRVTPERTIPQIKKFLDDGGTVITIGTSTNLAYHLGLPVSSYMTEKTPQGAEKELPREKFYVPGSILRVAVDNTVPVAAGMPNQLDVFFDDSPVFRLHPDAAMRGVRPIAWFDSKNPLRSGWAWGQGYLEGGVAVAEASVGKGKLYLFGPEITFRAQPHGTFKFLFNGIYGGSVPSKPGEATKAAMN